MKNGADREGGAGGGRCGAAGFPEGLRLNEKTGPTGREAPGEVAAVRRAFPKGYD